MKPLQMLIAFLLLHFLCITRSITAAKTPADEARTVSFEETLNSSCMSMALHQYYANNAHRPKKTIGPCDSQRSIQEAASSGVFMLQGSTAVHRDWLIDKTLKIGVPLKNGFNEFMKVERSPENYQTTVKGFPVDVFNAVIKMLSYRIQYEFIPYEGNGDAPGYYDSLISQVYFKEYDAVVGDAAITANRSDFVDFTFEYMSAGVSMIVPIQDDDTSSPWWFMKPLTTELWLTTLAFSLLKGILVWLFERGEDSDFGGSCSQVIGKIVSFSFSTFVFANTEKLGSNYSRFIINVWTFLVFVLVTSYAANLTSMLTVERLQPTISDVKSLIRNGDYVGYQKGSFVFELLKDLGFNDSKLKPYSTVDEYAEALSKGSGNDGVSAIVDELPYIRVFLKNHCKKYTKSDWSYRTGGFGFVFPRGSAILPDISRAVLNFSEGEKILELEKIWFGDQTKCPDSDSPVTNKKLPLYSLRSIYIIAGATPVIALLIYFIHHLYLVRNPRIRPQPESMVEFSAIDEAKVPDLIEINQDHEIEEGTNTNKGQSQLPRPHGFFSGSIPLEMKPWPEVQSCRTKRNYSTHY